MPFVAFDANGAVSALFRDDSSERTWLPLSDIRVLRFLQASDPALTTALLNASDDGHRLLLQSLISLLVNNGSLALENDEESQGKLEAHASLSQLIDAVESDDEAALHSLAQSDRNLVRIIEDVIDVLVRRRIIALADLPPSARHLLEMRRALRAYLLDTEDDVD